MISAVLALACAGLAFFGWVVDSPALRGFGLDIPIWPLTAIGFLSLALAQIAQLLDRQPVAFSLFAIPLIIGLAGMVPSVTGQDPGIHTLFFGEELAHIRAATPSRAAWMVMLDWVLLTGAMLLARKQTWRACLTACILADIPLALSILTIGLTVTGIDIDSGPAQFLWASLPASIATVLLSLSVFLWCRAAIFRGMAKGEDWTEWTFVRLFPLILLLPGLTWLLELIALTRGTNDQSLETAVLMVNIVLIGAVLAWAMFHMSRQQAALRDFTKALDSTLVVLIHPDGTVVHWSRGCSELFGWTAAEAVGANKYALLRTRFDTGEVDLLSLPPGGELKREVTDTTRDDRELRVQEHVRRIDGGRGTPVLVVALSDVTEQKKREADLEARRAIIRAILDTVPDGIIAFDVEGVVRRFSLGAVKMLGYEPQEAIGKHYTSFAPEERRAALVANFERYLQTSVPHFMGQVTRTSVLRNDGQEIPVEMRAVETFAGGDRLFIMFLRDLSETIANESRLGSLAAELGHVARLSAMGEMAAGMAHELNQPLTAIVNYTGAAITLLDDGGDIERARALVESANEQTLRAGQTIRRMREFASKGHVDVEAVAVDDIVWDAVSLVFVGSMPLEVHLEHDLDPRASLAMADRIQIQQVLVNLLRNAVQAMQRVASTSKKITISTRMKGNEMIEIGVSDTGPGIPQADRAALFAPFRTSSNKGGMGIGLSICRRIVEAHGGEIWVEDNKGEGATFRFTVPTPALGDDAAV